MSKNVLAVIPARDGSKGISSKNVISLCGKPLLSYTIEAALGCTLVSRTIVSTDDPALGEVASQCGAEVPFLRPAEFATDDVHAVNVVLHALNWFAQEESYVPDIVCMLLPTSPLRKARRIQEALELFMEVHAPAVVSVYCLTLQLAHLRRIVDGVLELVVSLPNPNVQRQEGDPLFALNGSIYVSTPRTLIESQTFHVPAAIPYIMAVEESVDINTPQDLKLAEYYLRSGSGDT